MGDRPLLFQPHALEQLASGERIGVTAAWQHVREIVESLGLGVLPRERPAVADVTRWAAAQRATTEELAELTAVVAALRLAIAIEPVMTDEHPERVLDMVRMLLERAPDTPHGDTSGVALLVEFVKQQRLRFEVTPGPVIA